MSRRIACIILSLIMAFVFCPVGAFADAGGDNPPATFGTKEARLENNEASVAIDIQTQCLAPPKVLIYQGSYCSAHQLKQSTIVNGINSVIPYADVDYYAAAKQYDRDTTVIKELKHFKRGTPISEADIYTLNTTTGMHVITQECLDLLMSYLDKGDYDYLVMILDGAMSTGLSAGSKDAIFNEKLRMRLTDEQYVKRRAYAEKLKDMNILYLVAPKFNSNDIVMYYDNCNANTAYNARLKYWDEKNFSTTNNAASLGYLNVHLCVEGLAFLAPKYYLTLTDPNTGKVTCTTPPSAGEIEYDMDNIVYYNEASRVAEKMKKIKEAILPVQLTITDVLADGLDYRSSAVEYSADDGATWQKVDDNLVEITKNGNKLKAVIDLSDSAFAKNRFRFLIKADVTESFGETIKTGKTNGDCEIEYENKDGDTIEAIEPASPTVTFTTFDVFYNQGDHGTLTGKAQETFRKFADNNMTTGSSVTPDQNYVHTGWICDDDVTFKDGTTAAKGTLLSNEQIASVVPTHEITFTAQYKMETRKVTYVVNPDSEWGIPEDSVTPKEESYPYGSDVTVEDNLATAQDYALDKNGKKVRGAWKFTPWDKDDFVIHEDTTITGAWKFTPEPLKVTYVVNPDSEWGIPEDSVTPKEETYPYGSDVAVEDNLSTAQDYALDKNGKKVRGAWEFTPWDKDDFVIHEDTTITGAWKFIPDPEEGADETVNTEDSEDEEIIESEEVTDDGDTPKTGDKGILIAVIAMLSLMFAFMGLVARRIE